MDHVSAHGAAAKRKKRTEATERTDRTKRWSIIASVFFAGLLTVGHAIGGIAGLFEGYRHTVEFLSLTATHTAPPKETAYTHLLNQLRSEFKKVKGALQHAEPADFSALDSVFATVRQLDVNNPTVPYYTAEIERIKDSAHFDADGCLQLPDQKTIPLNALHQLFYTYLEAARSAQGKLHSNDSRGDACYETEIGVCSQRTGWVNHLLANDFYELGLRAADKDEAIGYFEHARDFAKAAKDYQPPKGPVGFAQCIGTLTLEAKIAAKLRELQPAGLMTSKMH